MSSDGTTAVSTAQAKADVLRLVQDTFQRLALEHEQARGDLCRFIEQYFATAQSKKFTGNGAHLPAPFRRTDGVGFSRTDGDRDSLAGTVASVTSSTSMKPLDQMKLASRASKGWAQHATARHENATASQSQDASGESRRLNDTPATVSQQMSAPVGLTISAQEAQMKLVAGLFGACQSREDLDTSVSSLSMLGPPRLSPKPEPGAEAPKISVVAPGGAIVALPPNLNPEDTVLEALKKMFPAKDDSFLEPIADWLAKKFGVITYVDLEVAGSWGDAGMAIVNSDASLSSEAKSLLLELLGIFTSVLDTQPTPNRSPRSSLAPGSTEPRASMTPRHSMDAISAPRTQADVPLTRASLLSVETLGTQQSLCSQMVPSQRSLASVPEESLLAGLSKLLVGRSSKAVEKAAAWLEFQFGMAVYADIESIEGKLAQTGVTLVESDSSLDGETKAALQEVFNRLTSDKDPSFVKPRAVSDNAGSHGAPSRDARKGTDSSLLDGQKLTRSNFLILDTLGSGTFAVVHRVVDKQTQHPFALKEITAATVAQMTHPEQLQQEIDIHRAVDHPSILKCWSAFEDGGSTFLLLEFLEGGTLYQLMQREKVVKEPEAARVFTDVIIGIHYLHTNSFMHRDLKPENILLTLDRRAKIGDFGWSTMVTAQQFILECGSPAYFAPEMVDHCGYDQRVDVWASGILLYEMLVGYSPFASALTETETRKRISTMDFGYGAWFNVPAEVQPLLRNLLRREPSERPATVDILENAWLTSYVGTASLDAARRLERGLGLACE